MAQVHVNKEEGDNTMKNITVRLALLSLMLVSMLATADGHSRSKKEVNAMISQAEASLQSARNVGHEWTTTSGLIKKAKKALKENDLEKSYDLASKADAQGKASLQQKVDAEKFWTFSLPD